MSNKTTFKRIALGLVAAIGFGVLASAPTSAAVTGLTVTATNGAATNDAGEADSATAVIVSISFTKTADQDSATITSFLKSRPTGAAVVQTNDLVQMFRDSATSTMRVVADTDTAGLTGSAGLGLSTGETRTANTPLIIDSGATTPGSVAATFRVYIETTAALSIGNYVITSIVTPYDDGVAGTAVTVDGTIVVSRSTANSLTVDPAKSVAVMNAGTSVRATGSDSSVSVVATAASTVHAVIAVRTFNAGNTAAPESVTATLTGPGLLCDGEAGTACGKTLTLTGATGIQNIAVKADGTAGVATISIKTTSVTFPNKSVVFYAVAPATIVPSVEKPVIKTGAANGLDAIALDAKDANGNIWGGAAYLVSTDTAVASNAGTVACEFNATDGLHYCDVVGVAAGQSKFQVRDAATAAAATVTSAAFDGPRVTAETIASLKIEFDKAAYAPGEKARIYVTALDKDGKTLAGDTYANAFATGGIASSVAFSSGSDTTSSVSITTAEESSATTGAKAGSAMYTVYMPFGKGTVTLTAKGGASLPVAGQVALTATADVVDDSVDAAVDAAQEATDAAIAATDAAILAQEAADEAASAAIAAQETAQAAVDAVTALSAEVTKLVAQLATLQKLLNRVAKRVGVKL